MRIVINIFSKEDSDVMTLFKSMNEKLSKISLKSIFYNNKLTFFVSVMASFIIWIIINSSGASSKPITITDIPVSIKLSERAVQDGLRIFNGNNTKAQVDIAGNKLIVGQITKDDILVTAQQADSAITSPGKYTLELTAKKTGILSDYEFASGVQPAFINIIVDRYRETEFSIEPEIEFTANSKYFLGATSLSESRVMLSGPESEISKIKRVVAKGKITQELQSTYTTKVPVIMYDIYNEPIASEMISLTVSEVEVTIPVLKKKNVSIHPNFSNIPKGLDLSSGIIEVNPSSLEIAGPEEQINSMNKIELDSIDFNKINIENNKIELPINLPSGCKSLNNIYSAEVSVDMSKFKEKSFWVTQILFINIPEGKSAKAYTDGIDVKIVGYPSSIKLLSPLNIEAEIDLGGKNDLIGSMEIPAKIRIKNYKGVWAYGEYPINVEIL